MQEVQCEGCGTCFLNYEASRAASAVVASISCCRMRLYRTFFHVRRPHNVRPTTEVVPQGTIAVGAHVTRHVTRTCAP